MEVRSSSARYYGFHERIAELKIQFLPGIFATDTCGAAREAQGGSDVTGERAPEEDGRVECGDEETSRANDCVARRKGRYKTQLPDFRRMDLFKLILITIKIIDHRILMHSGLISIYKVDI